MVLHFDVAFAVEVVLDITKGWRNVWLNPKISPFFVSFGIDCNVVGFFCLNAAWLNDVSTSPR